MKKRVHSHPWEPWSSNHVPEWPGHADQDQQQCQQEKDKCLSVFDRIGHRLLILQITQSDEQDGQ